NFIYLLLGMLFSFCQFDHPFSFNFTLSSTILAYNLPFYLQLKYIIRPVISTKKCIIFPTILHFLAVKISANFSFNCQFHGCSFTKWLENGGKTVKSANRESTALND